MLPSEQGDKTKEQLTFLMAPGARLDGESPEEYQSKCQDLMDFVVNVNDEDVIAIENLQNGLRNARLNGVQGEFDPEYDWPIHRFQNMVIKGVEGANIDHSQ